MLHGLILQFFKTTLIGFLILSKKYKLSAEALGPRMKDRKKPDFDGSDIAFL